MDLHWRQPIWLQQVGCLAHNNAQMARGEHQIILPQKDQAKSLDSGNHQINFIHHWGIVTCLRSHHFQALPSSTTPRHLTWHHVRNYALLHPNIIWVMSYRSRDATSPQEVMVDLKCSPLSNSQDRGHHLMEYLKCLQPEQETIQWVYRRLPRSFHNENFAVSLWDLPLESKWNNFS
jgi:hypothetical protein